VPEAKRSDSEDTACVPRRHHHSVSCKSGQACKMSNPLLDEKVDYKRSGRSQDLTQEQRQDERTPKEAHRKGMNVLR